jgi:uncharacterized Fe-S cluster-containing radical SAM superfamily protein
MRKLNNPLQRIYDLSTKRTMAEKAEDLPFFPRMLDVELTNTCNMRCVMCPTGNGTVKRKKGFMDLALLEKVLDEAADFQSPIRYIRWGEPMVHPEFSSAIIETKVRNLICHINTNGKIFDEGWAEFLVTVGLDSIKFSFQGVNKRAYHDYRNSSEFHKLLQKIKHLHLYRESIGALFPFIQIGTTVTTEPKYIIDQFIRQVDSFTDAVYVGITRDLQQKTPSSVNYCECPEVFDKLSINFDGSVSACCGDYDNYTLVGDVNSQTLLEIWNGEPLAAFRKMLLEYRHNENYLCARCARTVLE